MKYFYLSLALVLSCFNISTAQCYMDRHSTSGQDAWLSCTATQNPNSTYGLSHWIMYDLGYEYDLADLQVWNANVPDSTDRGVLHLVVDYSLNGTDWIFLDEADLQESDGSSTYEGETVMNFNGQRARYVLLTATSNHGASCFSISEIKINIASTVVPISLVSFDVKCKEAQVEIRWQTDEEKNNDYFEIQRKSEGLEWQTIARIEAQDYKGNVLSYNYLDEQPLESESTFYRLAQIDQNGARVEYDAASVNCDTVERALNVYPNPAADRIEVLYRASENGEVVLALVNSLGQQVHQYKIRVNEKTQVDISQLKPGNYLLKIERGSTVIVKNLVKM